MKTKNTTVMITKKPLDKWNKENRATENDPNIVTENYTLMTTKLRGILRDHGECVSISNSLVLEILDAYAEKGKALKKAQQEIERLKAQLADSSCQ